MILIKVAIIDDNEYFSDMIKHYLHEHKEIEVVGCFKDKEVFIGFLNSNQVDIALLDVSLTDGNTDGIELIYDVLEIQEVKIIMLSASDNLEIYKEAFMAGASHYIRKLDFKLLPFIIKNVYEGNYPVQVLAGEYSKNRKEKLLKQLTPSEVQLLEYSIQGCNRQEISIKTKKSLSTLKNQTTSILKKFNSKNLKDASKKFKKMFKVL